MVSKIATIALLCAFLGYASSAGLTVMCYFESWTVYGSGDNQFKLEDFDPWMCSHMLYAFAGVNGNDGSIEIMDSYADVDLGGYRKFNDLKKNNYYLYTLLSVGGWSEGSTKFSNMAKDSGKRNNFIQSALKLLNTYGFNGLDIDWEYPGQRGGSSADKANFITLLRELRTEFDKHGYLLSAAVSSDPSSSSYDVPQLSRYLDFINVMTYDFHGSWEDRTGENSPLYSNDGANSDSAIKNWIKAGADPAKTLLGLGFYGKLYTLNNNNNNGIGAPASGGDEIDYRDICQRLQQGGWTEKWSDEQQVPYAYKGNQWIGYDNADSILNKVKYARDKDLGGVMIWAVDGDDFRGKCGEKLHLLWTIHRYYYPGSKSNPVNGTVENNL